MRNLLTRVPKAAQPFVATVVRWIFAQPDAEQVAEQHLRVVARNCRSASRLWVSSPTQLVPRSWPSRPCPRRSGVRSGPTTPWIVCPASIRRRTDVVDTLPNRAAALRLIGAVLAERKTTQWRDSGRRYMSLEAIAKTLTPDSEPVPEAAMIAA